MSLFTWPWQYSFPPFFTLQPNVETRRKQLEAWASLVLKYAEEKKISQLVVLDAQQCELFHNVKLNRKLNLDGIISVLDCLREKGDSKKLRGAVSIMGGFETKALNFFSSMTAEKDEESVKKRLKQGRVIWLDKQRSRCRIYWKSPAEWAELIYDWASRIGFRGTVCTLYEITHGPDCAGEPFQNLDDDCLLEALRHLEKCGKAEVMQSENDVASDGAKKPMETEIKDIRGQVSALDPPVNIDLWRTSGTRHMKGALTMFRGAGAEKHD